MGKYKNNYKLPYDLIKSELLENIANELAEANRLKRVELNRFSTSKRMEEDLKDQA